MSTKALFIKDIINRTKAKTIRYYTIVWYDRISTIEKIIEQKHCDEIHIIYNDANSKEMSLDYIAKMTKKNIKLKATYLFFDNPLWMTSSILEKIANNKYMNTTTPDITIMTNDIDCKPVIEYTNVHLGIENIRQERSHL